MSQPPKSQENGMPTGMITVVGLSLAMMAALINAYTNKGKTSSEFSSAITRYGMIQDFSLTDHRDQPFGINNVEGKVWVANFIFTSCATECPLLSRRMQDVQEAFKNDPRVELVSISIDPRTDNPKRLSKYAEAFKAGEKWAFLTGDSKEIEKLITKGFMVMAPGEAPEASSVRRTRQLLHSEKIAVVDQLGVVRFFANGMSPKAAVQVTKVVKTLLEAE